MCTEGEGKGGGRSTPLCRCAGWERGAEEAGVLPHRVWGFGATAAFSWGMPIIPLPPTLLEGVVGMPSPPAGESLHPPFPIPLQTPPLPPALPPTMQLVFTRSATGALDMVGQLMPWSAPAGGNGDSGRGGRGGGEEGSGSSSGGGSSFLYTRSNHNSALGEARAG